MDESTATIAGRRSNEFRLALASFVVALTVGSLAVGSGWYTANQREGHNVAPGTESFTRSRQADAYAGFINSASDLAQAVQRQVKAIENRYPIFLHSPVNPVNPDFEPKFTDFGHALNVAQLWGSARVRDESNKVFDAAAQSRSVVIGWDLVHPVDGPADAPCPELLSFENKTESDRQQLASAIDRFNDAAREDLGLPALPPTSTQPEPLQSPHVCTSQPH